MPKLLDNAAQFKNPAAKLKHAIGGPSRDQAVPKYIQIQQTGHGRWTAHNIATRAGPGRACGGSQIFAVVHALRHFGRDPKRARPSRRCKISCPGRAYRVRRLIRRRDGAGGRLRAPSRRTLRQAGQTPAVRTRERFCYILSGASMPSAVSASLITVQNAPVRHSLAFSGAPAPMTRQDS